MVRIAIFMLCFPFIMGTASDKPQIYKIIIKTKDVPGDIDTNVIKKLSEPLKAVAAFYSAMGGTMCDGENCELTTALGLGKQGSEKHIELLKRYFSEDKVAKAAIAQDCYLRPSGASSFSDYQYLTISQTKDTVKVLYRLLIFSRGETSVIEGPDIYVLRNNNSRPSKEEAEAGRINNFQRRT